MTMKHKIEKYRIKGLASKLAQRGKQEDSDQIQQSQQSLKNVAKGSGAATAHAAQNPQVIELGKLNSKNLARN